jgi:uncharacterized membrane protein YkvA (DUF1232 family)
MREVPLLLRRLARDVGERPLQLAQTAFGWKAALVFVIQLLYLLSPIDLIPEALFGAY